MHYVTKNTLGTIALLAIAGVWWLICLAAPGPVTEGQKLTIGQNGATLWFAPGGDNPAPGFYAKKLQDLGGGEKVIVESGKDGTNTNFVGFPGIRTDSGTWIRVHVTNGKVGWIQWSELKP